MANIQPFQMKNGKFVIKNLDDHTYLTQDIHQGGGFATYRYENCMFEAMNFETKRDAENYIARDIESKREYEAEQAKLKARMEMPRPRRVVRLMPGFTLDDAIEEINQNIRGHSIDLGFKGVSEMMMKGIAGCWNRKLRDADEVTHDGNRGDHFANIKAPVGYGGTQSLSPHDFTKVFYVGPPPPLSEYFMSDWFDPEDGCAENLWLRKYNNG